MTEIDRFRDQLVLALLEKYSNALHDYGRFAKWAYDIAESVIAERAKRISPISAPFPTKSEQQ